MPVIEPHTNGAAHSDYDIGHIAEMLSERVRAAGSQQAAAAELGINAGLISYVVRGEREPGPSLLEALGLPKRIRVTLENVDEVDISAEALAVLVRRLSLATCAVDGCEGEFYKIGNSRYCQRHSWATPEGRRYWRRTNGR